MQKPMVTQEQIDNALAKAGLKIADEKVLLLGLRKGRVGQNVGTFDDALIWVTEKDFMAFNGNTDPSREYPRVANLKAGAYRYLPGWHHGSFSHPIPAYVQGGDVTVLRYVDGQTWKPDTGDFGIHIHPNHGGNTTSSIGCQTVPAEEWPDFKRAGDKFLWEAKKFAFTYLLVDA